MRNFFWEGHKGSKINHLVKWSHVTRAQVDGGLSLGGLKVKNLALPAKWGWWFFNEDSSLWCQVISTIHGKNKYNWPTVGKICCSLQSPWISLSRNWLKVDAFKTFKLAPGTRIAFWHDLWVGLVPLSLFYPRLFRIAILPSSSVSDLWHYSSSLWSLFCHHLLKDKEIAEFQNLMGLISRVKVSEHLDWCLWPLEAHGVFPVKSLTTHLS